MKMRNATTSSALSAHFPAITLFCMLCAMSVLPSAALFSQVLPPTWDKLIVDDNLSASVLTAADLDGDGDTDIIATAWEIGDVAWYRNDSESRSWTKQYFNASLNDPIGVAVGDMNNDSRPDVVVASLGSNEIFWFENALPDSQWVQHSITSSISSPKQVYVTDINNDGYLDVLVSPGSGSSIYWLENTGASGVFDLHTVDNGFTRPRKLACGDINGDGAVDIVAASSDLNEIRLYMTSLGIPQNWTTYTVDNSLGGARAVFIGDIDADDDLDIAATGVSAHTIVYYENTGADPTMWSKHVIDADFRDARVVSIADVDNGGLPDIIATSTGQNRLVWYCHEDGWKCTDIPETTLSGARSFVVCDLDNDTDGAHRTDLDIVVAAQNAKDVVIFYNGLVSTEEVSWRARTIDANLRGPSVLSIADLDGDADLDIAVTAWEIGDVVWYRNECHAQTWSKETVHPNVRDVIGVEIGDVDGDALPDIIAASGGANEVLWFENTLPDTGAKQWPVHIVGTNVSSPGWIDAADLDGDGDLDVLVSPDVGSTFYWYENEGGSPVQWSQHIVDNTLGTPRQLFAGDINGDGALDIVAAGESADAVHLYMTDLGIPTNWTKYVVDDNLDGAIAVCMGDVDGDGDMDIAATGRGANAVVYYENDGSRPNSWPKHVIDTMLNDARHVAIADINGGGLPDLIASSHGSDRLVCYSQEENWRKRDVSDDPVPGARIFSVISLDDDTDPDIVLLTQTSHDVIFFSNQLTPNEPAMHCSQTMLDFDSVEVGYTAELPLTITNSGTSVLTIGSLQLCGPEPVPFSIADTTGFHLTSCIDTTLIISCTPVMEGIWRDTLHITCDDSSVPDMYIELIVNGTLDANDAPLPKRFHLGQNHPNPFNPATEIAYEIPAFGNVRLSVHDLLGREMRVLLDEPKPGGNYQVRFDGIGLPSGVYIYRLRWNDRSVSRKMILMK